MVDPQAGPAARYPVRQFPWLSGLLDSRYRVAARTAEGVIHARIAE